MKPGQLLWALTVTVLMMSCSKNHGYPNPHTPPPPSTKKILLKDIVIPSLPSPYYHFEYSPDSLVTRADFASGFNNYNVFYSGGRVSEMRNNIIVNHDTLRYIYDNAGKVAIVKFISENNITYRHVVFTWSGQQVTKIEWDHKDGTGFIIDRILDFTYHSDGNLKEMHQHRPALQGLPEIDYSRHYDQYDNKVNVDDNTLIHDGIHDHFLVLPNLNLQRNNPKKEWLTGGGNHYTVDYTYTYNSDNAPVSKTGNLLFTSGTQTGQRFTTHTNYSYY